MTSQTYAGITAAGGAGVHGQVDPTGPVKPLEADATFSQGIVQVHQRSGLLATVNVSIQRPELAAKWA